MRSSIRIRSCILLFSIFSLCVSSCWDDEEGNASLYLILNDDEGIEKSQFLYGENVIFILKLSNKSSSDFTISEEEICSLLNHENFLLVSRIDRNPLTSIDTLSPIGKPYTYPVNCNLLEYKHNYKTGNHNILQYSWIDGSNSNSPMEPGQYITSLDYELFDSKVPLNIDLRFEILEKVK